MSYSLRVLWFLKDISPLSFIMTYALYTRVSTEEQTTDNQRIRLVEYCENNNLEYELFSEVMSSRKTRPVKAKLLQRLRNNEFQGVIIYKLDRWARSTSELILEIEEIHNKGIKFISLSDNIDLNTSMGKLQLGILSSFAQFERDLIRERTLEGLNRAKKQGKQLGRPQGSKDKKVRKKGGYYVRYMKTKV